ncbi:acylphosphatase [Thalassoroseus pseudoceratinae]|uniref:acylphosphatase n=1 Tax=Thalassoroseus pseudoceratinae TaxID=2713176 RepID=UPI00197DF672|nr:acylphosphatase [Thalassoroseus pseudoceratinae]
MLLKTNSTTELQQDGQNMSDADSKICRRIVFHGRVQGVGFRMTTERLAQKYEVVGYVKNLTDGTVEMLVQADADEIERFLNTVRQRFSGYIEAEESSSCEESMKKAANGCRAFTTRY